MRALGGLIALALLAVPLSGCLDAVTLGGMEQAEAESNPAFERVCMNAPPEWPDACTTVASPNDSPSKTEVDLVVNPTNPDNIVVASKDLDRKASDCVWSVAQVTMDGGETWETVYVGGDRENRHPALAPFACVTDPMMVFGSDGTLYYALQAYRAGLPPTEMPTGGMQPVVGSTFILARSTDGGFTWDHFALQHAGDGVAQFHDYPRIIENPKTGAIHTVWNGVGGAYVPVGLGAGGVFPWVSSTYDGGDTMEAPKTFAVPGSEGRTAFASGFVATRDGTIYVNAWDSYGDTRTLHVFKSTDDARSFDYVGEAFDVCYPPRTREQNDFRTPGFVEFAIDNTGGVHDGRLYAIWTQHCDGQSDILVAWSDDGAASWSDPVEVNDDEAVCTGPPEDVPPEANVTAYCTPGNDQFFPRGKVTADGALHVLFVDRRWDPENTFLDMTHAVSTDGGATWTNTRLTESPFDGDLGVHQNGPPFIGDYNGIDVHGTDVFMAWGDTRTGVAEIAFTKMRAVE